MKKFYWIGFLLMLASAAQAAEVEGCAAAEVTTSEGDTYTFWQHQFAEGGRDLVMASAAEPAEIKRVTFNNTQNCAYPVLAIAEGSNETERWGWHLAWADAKTLYYARMDGEAWVSSVPKKMAAENVTEINLLPSPEILTLNWLLEAGVGFNMLSDDEGRTWHVPLRINTN